MASAAPASCGGATVTGATMALAVGTGLELVMMMDPGGMDVVVAVGTAVACGGIGEDAAAGAGTGPDAAATTVTGAGPGRTVSSSACAFRPRQPVLRISADERVRSVTSRRIGFITSIGTHFRYSNQPIRARSVMHIESTRPVPGLFIRHGALFGRGVERLPKRVVPQGVPG